ncbi:GYD domain-containing protein [Cupriavidus necator]|uniref:GYD domain-containing protein n=1 Tax=Cupriavidus necator TaxID=106590 RepID=UPI003ED02E6C
MANVNHILRRLPRSRTWRYLDVKWLGSYVTLGPYNCFDIFEANNIEAAMQVSVLVGAYGHGETSVHPAVDWGQFKHLVRNLPELPPV